MDDIVRTALQEANGVDDGFLTPYELKKIGFEYIGREAKVSRKCSFYSFKGRIGDFSRIDDFCIFKGQVDLGSYVHIAAYSLLGGTGGPIRIGDFTAIAARMSIYTSSDDYRTDTLSGPCIPNERDTCIINGPVSIGISGIIGVNCVILPNVTIGDGVSIGGGCIMTRDVADGAMLRMPRNVITMEKKRDYKKIRAMAAHVMDENK